MGAIKHLVQVGITPTQAELIGAYTVNLTAQTGAISATTIVTPKESGFYIFAFHSRITNAGTSGNLLIDLIYALDSGAITSNQLTRAITGLSEDYASSIFWQTAPLPIQYQTSLSGTAGALTYNLDISVLRIG